MMCIGDIQYINTQHRNRCTCERKRVLIASEQAMSENNEGWMDGYVQSGIQSIIRGEAWFYSLGGIDETVSESNTKYICAWQMTSGLRNSWLIDKNKSTF
jgi:hypothetical protein